MKQKITLYFKEVVHMLVHILIIFLPLQMGIRLHDRNAEWAYGKDENMLAQRNKQYRDSLFPYNMTEVNITFDEKGVDIPTLPPYTPSAEVMAYIDGLSINKSVAFAENAMRIFNIK